MRKEEKRREGECMEERKRVREGKRMEEEGTEEKRR